MTDIRLVSQRKRPQKTPTGHTMKAIIHIMPKQDVLDPQGRTIAQSLKEQGFPVHDVRCGKRLELVFDKSPDVTPKEQEKKCLQLCHTMCDAMLVNGLIEQYHIDIDP